MFDQFRLEASNGGNFTATLGANGLTLPSGARLLYKGVMLTAPALPSFTIAANGDFSLSVSVAMTAGLRLNNFTINNSSFNLVRSAGVTAAAGFNGSLTIPGLSVAASVTVAGSLNSNGTFSLTGATSGALSLNGAVVSALASGATAALNQNGFTLTGNLSGGSLAQAGLSSVTGALTISATGTISASATVSVAPLVFDQFRLEASNGGNFTATLGANGLSIPTGARLLYKGVVLTLPALPQFTIAANGDFSLSVSAAMTSGLKLNNFTINNSSFNLARTAGVTAATGFNGSLTISGLSAAAAVTVAGSLNSNGAFNLNYTGAFNLGSFSLANGILNLSNTGLTASGGLSVAGLQTLSLSGAIQSTGAFVLTQNITTQTFFLFPVQNVAYTLSATAGSTVSLTAAMNLRFTGLNATLNNSNAQLKGTLRTDGFVDIHLASPVNLTVAGYGMTSVSLSLTRLAGSTSLATLAASGNFAIAGVNRQFSGTVGTGGSIGLEYNGPFSLAGFSTLAGSLSRIRLFDTGMTAEGTFDLRATGSFGTVGFGKVSFSGDLKSDGTYSLAGSGALSLGGFNTENFDMTLSSNGISLKANSSGNLKYGNITVPFSTLNLNSGGISSFNGSQDRDSGWQTWPFAVYGRLKGKTTLSSSPGGTISGQLSATFYWWVGGLTPASDFYPSNQSVSVSGGIGSDGKYNVGENHGGQSGFGFTLW